MAAVVYVNNENSRPAKPTRFTEHFDISKKFTDRELKYYTTNSKTELPAVPPDDDNKSEPSLTHKIGGKVKSSRWNLKLPHSASKSSAFTGTSNITLYDCESEDEDTDTSLANIFTITKRGFSSTFSLQPLLSKDDLDLTPRYRRVTDIGRNYSKLNQSTVGFGVPREAGRPPPRRRRNSESSIIQRRNRDSYLNEVVELGDIIAESQIGVGENYRDWFDPQHKTSEYQIEVKMELKTPTKPAELTPPPKPVHIAQVMSPVKPSNTSTTTTNDSRTIPGSRQPSQAVSIASIRARMDKGAIAPPPPLKSRLCNLQNQPYRNQTPDSMISHQSHRSASGASSTATHNTRGMNDDKTLPHIPMQDFMADIAAHKEDLVQMSKQLKSAHDMATQQGSNKGEADNDRIKQLQAARLEREELKMLRLDRFTEQQEKVARLEAARREKRS
jgi:hypothetical protein